MGRRTVPRARRRAGGRLPGNASPAAQDHWGADELVADDDPMAVAERLAAAVDAAGADALNLRLHVPGIDPESARAQLALLGDEVLAPLRKALQ